MLDVDIQKVVERSFIASLII